MSRTHVDEYYTAYLEGSLPEDLRQAVETHLRNCPQCAAELDEVRAMVACLQDLPAVPVPDGFAAGVRARLPRPVERRPVFWRGPLLAGGLLASAAVAVLLVLQVNPFSTPMVKSAPQAPGRREITENTGTRDLRDNSKLAAKPGSDYHPPEVVPVEPQPAYHVNDPFNNSGGAGEDSPLFTDSADVNNDNANGRLYAALPESRVDIAVAPPVSVKLGAEKPPEMQTKAVTPRMESVSAADMSVTQPKAASIPAAPPVASAGTMANAGSSSARSVQGAGPAGPAGEATAPPTMDSATVAKSADGMATDAQRSKSVPAPPPAMIETGPLQSSASYAQADKPAATVLPKSASARGIAIARLTQTIEYGEAVQPPDATGSRVTLHLATAVTGKLAIAYTGSAQRVQTTSITTPANTIRLTLPALPKGALLQLSLSHGKTTDRLYLVVPGTGTREATMTLHARKQPVKQLLQRLSTGIGVFVLCPTAFAETTTTFTADNMPPYTAIGELADQLHYDTDLNGSVLNISKRP
ncbi:MAG: anti-sigma factor family protein [Armatimonadota bacterium]